MFIASSNTLYPGQRGGGMSKRTNVDRSLDSYEYHPTLDTQQKLLPHKNFWAEAKEFMEICHHILCSLC